MKLKFTPEAEEVINSISSLPDVPANEQDFDKPFNFVRALSSKLIREKDRGKNWNKIRRELSFFYNLQVICEKRTEDKALRYTELVKSIKAIKSGVSLQSTPFIRVALSYGVIRLSNFEIELLIKHNKI